jgi:hypothetical protein
MWQRRLRIKHVKTLLLSSPGNPRSEGASTEERERGGAFTNPFATANPSFAGVGARTQ